MGWVVAAAAIVILFVFPPGPRSGDEPRVTGVPPVRVILPAPEDSAVPVRVQVPQHVRSIQLFFDTSLADEDFPVVLRVVAATGAEIFRSREVTRDELLGGVEIPFACDRRDCPDGDYTARVITRDPAAPVVAYSFTLVSAPPSP
ncbi:MAG TPA: hypothetical protein VNI57_13005 [Candidatus Saccharimonadales bacterium]|nr:hypothetical protein [Candidatus Saccharimonadales bacterium]